MSDDLIYTDDEARGLPYEYRGPVNLELPPARPAAYGVALALTVLGWFLTWLLAPGAWFTLAGVVLAPALAVYVTRKAMRHVDYYRTVRHWTSVGRHELAAPRVTQPEAPTFETRLDPTMFKEGRRR